MSFEIQIRKSTYVGSRMENCFLFLFLTEILFGENAEQNISRIIIRVFISICSYEGCRVSREGRYHNHGRIENYRQFHQR